MFLLSEVPLYTTRVGAQMEAPVLRCSISGTGTPSALERHTAKRSSPCCPTRKCLAGICPGSVLEEHGHQQSHFALA